MSPTTKGGTTRDTKVVGFEGGKIAELAGKRALG